MADTNRSLWQVMHSAYHQAQHPRPSARAGYAAEIHAVARFLAEAERNGEFTSDGLYGWLLAEADRAEEGE